MYGVRNLLYEKYYTIISVYCISYQILHCKAHWISKISYVYYLFFNDSRRRYWNVSESDGLFTIEINHMVVKIENIKFLGIEYFIQRYDFEPSLVYQLQLMA